MDKDLVLATREALSAWHEQRTKEDEIYGKAEHLLPVWLNATEPTFKNTIALAKVQACFRKAVEHYIHTAVDHGLLLNRVRISDTGYVMIQTAHFNTAQHLAHRYLQHIALMNERAVIGLFNISPTLSGKHSLVVQLVSPTSRYLHLPFEEQSLKELELGNYIHGKHFKINR